MNMRFWRKKDSKIGAGNIQEAPKKSQSRFNIWACCVSPAMEPEEGRVAYTRIEDVPPLQLFDDPAISTDTSATPEQQVTSVSPKA